MLFSFGRIVLPCWTLFCPSHGVRWTNARNRYCKWGFSISSNWKEFDFSYTGIYQNLTRRDETFNFLMRNILMLLKRHTLNKTLQQEFTAYNNVSRRTTRRHSATGVLFQKERNKKKVIFTRHEFGFTWYQFIEFYF